MYLYKNSLETLGSAPPGTTGGPSPYLGSVITGTITASTSTPATLTIPVAGIYLFSFNITLNSGGAYQTWGTTQITGANVPSFQSWPSFSVNASNSVGGGGSLVVNATASTYSITFSGSSSAYSVSSGFCYFQATRIG